MEVGFYFRDYIYNRGETLLEESKVQIIEDTKETETLVALEMMKIFMRDDMENCAKVRKQILKGMEVDYFKKEKYKFGDKLNYCSPKVNNLKTPCLFIRNAEDKWHCYVVFPHADKIAKVEFKQLERIE